jgi:hypothetical protein
MKTFITQLSDWSAPGLRILTALLILQCVSLDISAQGITMAPAENRLSGLLTDDSSQPIALGLVSLVRVSDALVLKELLTHEQGLYTFIDVAPGTYLVRASTFGFFEETSSKPFVITNEQKILTVPDLKMERNISRVKYWQTGWYQPFINPGKSNQKDTSKNYMPEKYWQADWFDNMP